MIPELEHVYRYAVGSVCHTSAHGFDLRLDTSGPGGCLAAGWVQDGAPYAAALLAVARAARCDFRPVAPGTLYYDPVVTCHLDVLRFEALSSCRGVYVRFDVDASSLDGEVRAAGATNVDFNAPMRTALARVAHGPMRIEVGRDAFTVLTAEGVAVEHKVPLPVTWIRALGEAQITQAGMRERLAVDRAAAIALLRSLPKSQGATCFHAVSGSRGVRLSSRAGANSVQVCGVDRLRLLEPLLPWTRSVRVYGGEGGASAWVAELPGARVHLVLSPEVWRGFSGEGGALGNLADDATRQATLAIRSDLAWQSRLTGPAASDTDALSVLCAEGVLGFDLTSGAYFHRELPFSLADVERLHPRLGDARALVASGDVRPADEPGEFWVRGSGVDHRVRLGPERSKCTCTWFARHQGQRGPCKHVLAAELASSGA